MAIDPICAPGIVSDNQALARFLEIRTGPSRAAYITQRK